MKMQSLFPVAAMSLAAASFFIAGSNGGAAQFTRDFGLERCNVLLPTGENDFFSLQPGTFLRLEGDDDDEFVRVDIRVTREMKPIAYRIKGQWKLALTRVVEEKEWIDGELVEVSKNYFARCPDTNNIFYFGEDVDFYNEDGRVVGHDGSWLAGENGAQPGLIMPGLVLAGSRYYQEYAPDVALDRAEHIKTTVEIHTPAGTFTHCLRVVETTPLEPGEESVKVYAPGVGIVQDNSILLVKFEKGDKFQPSKDAAHIKGVQGMLQILGFRVD